MEFPFLSEKLLIPRYKTPSAFGFCALKKELLQQHVVSTDKEEVIGIDNNVDEEETAETPKT